MKMKKLINCFSDSDKSSRTMLFDALYNFLHSHNIEIPVWMDTQLKRESLDESYILQHSGDKFITKYADMHLTNGLFDTNTGALMFYGVFLKFKDSWQHIYDALNIEYNPIENYNSLEIETPNLHQTSKFKTQNKINTFNSTNAEDLSSVSGNADENEIVQSGNKEITKSGNIGVTTSQQMIESELQLRKHQFYEILFDDLDSVICLQIY